MITKKIYLLLLLLLPWIMTRFFSALGTIWMFCCLPFVLHHIFLFHHHLFSSLLLFLFKLNEFFFICCFLRRALWWGGARTASRARDSITMVMMKKKETYSLLLLRRCSFFLFFSYNKPENEPGTRKKKNVNEARDGEKISWSEEKEYLKTGFFLRMIPIELDPAEGRAVRGPFHIDG